ncbi:MAG: DUF4382 domain-containing protein [Planctomycetota bacterium]
MKSFPFATRSLVWLAATAFVFVLAACSDDDDDNGGGGGSAAATGTDILFTDAPSDDLLAFHATVTELRLDISGGGQTANLLTAPVTLDLLDLSSAAAWLQSGTLPSGTYIGAHLAFAPASYSARLNDGSTVAVTATSDALTMPFATDLVVDGDDYDRLVLDLDLATSLSGDVATPPLSFTPSGDATHDTGAGALPIAPLRGTVRAVNATSFVMDAFVNGDPNQPLGEVEVDVGSAPLLVDENGGTVASTSTFLSTLVNDTSVVDVRGTLEDGDVQANRVQIDSLSGGTGSVARIHGLVIDTADFATSSTFEIAVAGVDQGESLVAAAFGGSVPQTITVTVDPSTAYFVSDTSATSTALALGHTVDLTFDDFTAAPFVASDISIAQQDVTFSGTITSTAGLPNEVTVQLNALDAAVLGGAVESGTTDVTVDVSGSNFAIGPNGQTLLLSDQLQPGMEIHTNGAISGTAQDPIITANDFMVTPGKLSNATVTNVKTGGTNTLTVTDGTLGDPFADNVTLGTPIVVRLDPTTTFDGDVTTQQGFIDMFDALGVGETMTVDVQGLGTTTSNQVEAFHVTTTGPTTKKP